DVSDRVLLHRVGFDDGQSALQCFHESVVSPRLLVVEKTKLVILSGERCWRSGHLAQSKDPTPKQMRSSPDPGSQRGRQRLADIGGRFCNLESSPLHCGKFFPPPAPSARG